MRMVQVFVLCPRCGKLVKQYEEKYSILAAWAYKYDAGVYYYSTFDGRDCCY